MHTDGQRNNGGQEKKKKEEHKGLNKRDRNPKVDTITAFVRQVLGEWKELDSDKIVPHFKQKEKKK